MKQSHRYIAAAAIIIAVTGPASAGANDGSNTYVVTPLVSDLPGAPVTDPNLKNAWGVAFTPSGSPFWIADNATGRSTLYDGDGTIVPLVVTIPGPVGSPAGFVASPTAMVWNPTTSTSTGFLIPKTGSLASFLWATEDGTISAWTGGLTPPTQAVLAVDNSKVGAGAVYKGLVFGVLPVGVDGPHTNAVFLYATNFRAGTVEMFAPGPVDTATGFYFPSTSDGGFLDPDIPQGYAPFGIQNIDGDLFVTYAQQDAAKHDDVAGKGHGFVDVFDTNGHLLRRFASRGTLNSPWGVARASYAFGKFSGDILIGNFGDGRINVFDSNGHFIDQLKLADGTPVMIDGLWTLTLGGGAKSSTDSVYFTAGPNGETDGLFGTITPAAANSNP